MNVQDGISPFPRSLPDNCVEYMLFLLDDALEPRGALGELEEVRRTAMRLCAATAGDYIWQRDCFQLQVKRQDGLVFLHGTTDYGDSVEDEWLIVYLLHSLTTTFPSLWARVFDSDGEFLLVEAASVVPEWLSPEIDSHRAWVHQGKLQLLPLSASSGVKRSLALAEAVSFIKLHPAALVHSPFVESEAFYRLEKYPGAVKASMHHALATVPRKLAYILHQQPAAISPAIEAFYLRDPVIMKPLMATSPDLHFPPTDLVTVSIKFTKVLFAQAKSQHFAAPPAWSGLIQSDQEVTDRAPEQEPKKAARLELGMKITSGFEMLAANASGKENRLAREFAILLEDAEEDGDAALPTDENIGSWPDADREDDEAWLDINFQDFENELQGRRGEADESKNGFGDAKTQADLRKIVSRFEDFLNDETAGFEGADLNDMDHDNDSSDDAEEDDDDNSSEDEDKAVSFDEDQFDKMMREMMGLPPEDGTGISSGIKRSGLHGTASCGSEDEGGEEEEEDIRQLAAQMESELKGLGALRLDRNPARGKALEPTDRAIPPDKGKGIAPADEESEDEEVDIDYNLAKNILESFKSQAGLAGPAGNLLGMMGMKLPRDEDEDEE
ncbi:SGT1-domain-containing protein [Nemania sp. FL0916]|nr:SGT1-domain-containing protein [Nemania sp. FL0916]